MVEGVASHLKNLNLLSLFGIVTITDASIKALANSESSQSIETLDVNGCREITLGRTLEEMRVLFPLIKVLVYHS